MEQQKKTDRTEELMEIARLRFGMIAPVIQETYPDESVMAYCRRVAETPMRLPDGRTVKYKPKTIGKWVSLYRNGRDRRPDAENAVRPGEGAGAHRGSDR